MELTGAQIVCETLKKLGVEVFFGIPGGQNLPLNDALGQCGIRYQDRTDLMLAVVEPGTTVAGVFTRSLTASAPVEWCRKAVKGGQARAVVVNSGNSNAFTSFDQTVYVNTVPAGEVELALWLEADRMASFKVSPTIFATERQVVTEEWRLRPAQLDGEHVLQWTGDAARFLGVPGQRFKFVTGEYQWLVPPGMSQNRFHFCFTSLMISATGMSSWRSSPMYSFTLALLTLG